LIGYPGAKSIWVSFLLEQTNQVQASSVPTDGLEFVRLSGAPTWDFRFENDEKDKEQVEFFKDHAWEDQQDLLSVTYEIQSNGTSVGFITLIMDELILGQQDKPRPRLNRIAGLKIAQLAIDRNYQAKKYGLRAIEFAIEKAIDFSEEVGCRFITTDAIPDKKGFYEKYGFVVNKKEQRERRKESSEPDDLAISMRLDILPYKLN